MPKNPWLKLTPKPPYILPEDIEKVEKFNKKEEGKHLLCTNLFAVPYSGNPFKAKIIFLQLNPGMDTPKGFECEKDDFTGKNIFGLKTVWWKNLKHKSLKYPFDNLNPQFRLGGGFRYWTKIFTNFLYKKEDYQRISERVCCIEFFPYHSKNFKYLGSILECQKYNFYLVQQAIKRNATIILMRGKEYWEKNVPELKNYKYITLRSKRNVLLSKNNLGEKNYRLLEKILSN